MTDKMNDHCSAAGAKPGEACSAAPATSRLIYKPHYLLLLTTATIFVAEFMVMLVLYYLPTLCTLGNAVIDAVVLTLTVFPSLYYFLLKPMQLHIQHRMEAEAEKDRLIVELQRALDEVKTLRGIVPMCAWCKSVRNDNGYWQQVEDYMSSQTGTEFSHGICPKCLDRVET